MAVEVVELQEPASQEAVVEEVDTRRVLRDCQTTHHRRLVAEEVRSRRAVRRARVGVETRVEPCLEVLLGLQRVVVAVVTTEVVVQVTTREPVVVVPRFMRLD